MTFSSLHTTSEPIYTSTSHSKYFLQPQEFTQTLLPRPQTIIPIFHFLKPHRTSPSSPKITHNTITSSLKSPIHHNSSFQGQHHSLHSQNGCQFDLLPLRTASPAQLTNRISADKSSWYHKRLTNLILDIKVIPLYH